MWIFISTIFSSDDVYDEEEDDMNCTKDEDELERAELRRLQRQMDDQTAESQEERDYKEEFFELLDEVNVVDNLRQTKVNINFTTISARI